MRFARAVLLLLTSAFPLVPALSQTDPEYQMEIGAGVGIMSYEGDFNGSILKCGKPSAAILARYLLNPRMGFRLQVNYGKLSASAENMQTAYPDYTTELYDGGDDYEFSNTLVDMNLMFEYNFWPYGTGRDYRGAKRLTPYVMLGVGMTYADGSDDSAFTMNVPLGIGVKYKLAKRLNLNVEWAMHFSLSDKLDGVKDPYYVESSGIFKNADCYSALMVNLTYSFKEKCRTCHNDDE